MCAFTYVSVFAHSMAQPLAIFKNDSENLHRASLREGGFYPLFPLPFDPTILTNAVLTRNTLFLCAV